MGDIFLNIPSPQSLDDLAVGPIEGPKGDIIQPKAKAEDAPEVRQHANRGISCDAVWMVEAIHLVTTGKYRKIHPKGISHDSNCLQLYRHQTG